MSGSDLGLMDRRRFLEGITAAGGASWGSPLVLQKSKTR